MPFTVEITFGVKTVKFTFLDEPTHYSQISINGAVAPFTVLDGNLATRTSTIDGHRG